MQKVYAEKQLDLSYECAAETGFYGDKTDLLELLGNLLDNACKAANSQVFVSASTEKQQLIIQIDDGRPRVFQYKLNNSFLQRGKTPGQLSKWPGYRHGCSQ